MTDDRLARALSGSLLVEYDEETGLVYAWDGSLTISIYSYSGVPADTFRFSSLGYGSLREAARDAIRERMALDREGLEKDD